MQNITTRTVREIALESPATTRVFESFNIDYCCGGRINFVDACRNAGAEPDVVLSQIETTLSDTTDDAARLTELSLSDLIDHILETHHKFTYYELEHLPALMTKVEGVHGESHPELHLIADLFTRAHDDLLPHMYKEEQVLFPYVKDLEARTDRGLSVAMPPFGTVRHPIKMMMNEHDAVGDILREMRAVSNNYKLPEGACPSYSGLFSRLESLERDLHQHIHLENNLLFPKAAELETLAFG